MKVGLRSKQSSMPVLTCTVAGMHYPCVGVLGDFLHGKPHPATGGLGRSTQSAEGLLGGTDS